MILVDLNSVIFGRIVIEFSKEKIDKKLLRHIILDTLQRRILTHRADFGNVVIAKDGKKYWRKDIFPFYKQNRAAAREASKINWPLLFTLMDELAEEFKVFLPYPFVWVDRAEADDVIVTLAKEQTENVLILSEDKDFAQLQKWPHVKQYNPNKKKWVTIEDPAGFLEEHIFRGDSSDGIPNILNPDSCLALKVRQKPLYKTKLDLWLGQDPSMVLNETELRNYHRNRALIDLSLVPDDVSTAILNEYRDQAAKPKKSLYKYFYDNDLKNLMESINDF